MKILVTGCAGFIGYHVSKYLLKNNHEILGIDNLNNYYDVNLKKSRIKVLKKYKRFKFNKFDLINVYKIDKLIKQIGRAHV